MKKIYDSLPPEEVPEWDEMLHDLDGTSMSIGRKRFQESVHDLLSRDQTNWITVGTQTLQNPMKHQQNFQSKCQET